MSVGTEVSRVDYECDGSAEEFPITFTCLRDTLTGKPYGFKVLWIEADGTVNELELDVDYEVSTGDIVDTSLHASSPFPAFERLVMLRDGESTQLLNLVEGGSFSAEAIERSLDKLTMKVQELEENMNRVMLTPEHESVDMALPNKSDRAGRNLVFDSNGQPATRSRVLVELDEYRSGWFYNATPGGSHFLVQHDLDADFASLWIKLFMGDDIDGTNAQPVASVNAHDNATAGDFGIGFHCDGVSRDAFYINSATNGLLWVDDAGNIIQSSDIAGAYFNIIVLKLELG